MQFAPIADIRCQTGAVREQKRPPFERQALGTKLATWMRESGSAQTPDPPPAMILHEQIFNAGKPTVLEWWAVNTDTLTLAKCVVRRGPKFSLEVVKPPRSSFPVRSFPSDFDLGDSAIEVLIDCRHRFKQLSTCPCNISQIRQRDAEIPEYILLGVPGDVPEAIMHTCDPSFVALYQFSRCVAGSRNGLLSYQSKTNLPEAGWDYWCTDARQEFERLSDQYLEQIQRQLAGAI